LQRLFIETSKKVTQELYKPFQILKSVNATQKSPFNFFGLQNIYLDDGAIPVMNVRKSDG
jgi:hypothetical protein